jgi:hypothetical protein
MLCYTRFNMPTTKQKKSKKAPHPIRRLAVQPFTTSEGNEPDSTYFLKLVLYVLLGTFWIRFSEPITWLGIPFGAVPVGVLIGFLFVRWFEKYPTDRKIWYAILVVVAIIGNFAASGVII